MSGKESHGTGNIIDCNARKKPFPRGNVSKIFFFYFFFFLLRDFHGVGGGWREGSCGISMPLIMFLFNACSTRKLRPV